MKYNCPRMNPDLLRRFLRIPPDFRQKVHLPLTSLKTFLGGRGILFFTIHYSPFTTHYSLLPAFRLYLQDDPYLTKYINILNRPLPLFGNWIKLVLR